MLLFNKGLQHLALKSRAATSNFAMQVTRMPLSQNAMQMRTFMTNMSMVQRSNFMMMQRCAFSAANTTPQKTVQIKVIKNTVTDDLAVLEQ